MAHLVFEINSDTFSVRHMVHCTIVTTSATGTNMSAMSSLQMLAGRLVAKLLPGSLLAHHLYLSEIPYPEILLYIYQRLVPYVKENLVSGGPSLEFCNFSSKALLHPLL